ncbi:uncharacterized protein LOC124283149 [Haliotis rubra]|uniref:uncharacterized protein LOC124283149 n=1 Tax=Haliotis rubra TaxID=36100 RepID=UPI001EE52226|nr:uncharacterized protein LOC124283149 [Haliotis rubra]
MQKFDVFCSDDVTGTFIKSNTPISVLAGVTFPGEPGWEKFIEEMLLPEAFFGKNFILPAISEAASVLRVVASENGTEIYSDGNFYTYMDAGDYLDVVSNEIFCLKGSRPIQVMLLGRRVESSFFIVDDLLGDPIMAIVPAVERFQKFDKIDIFPFPGESLVVFFVETGQNITSLPPATYAYTEHSECCNIEIYYLSLFQSVVEVDLNVSVGLMQLAISGSKGFGLMMGSSLDPPECRLGSGYAYLSSSGLCIKTFTTMKSWTNARTICRGKRLRLVSLDTQNKIDSINSHLENLLHNFTFSIGLRLDHGSSYTWINGETLDTTNWLQLQPTANGLCVQLAISSTDIGWQNVYCDVDSAFVCEVVLAETQEVQIFTGLCQNSHPGCPTADGYTYIYEAELCVKHHLQPQSWVNAAVACRADGGRLVTVDSDTKQYYLHRVYRHISPKHYIGGSWHSFNNGRWVWADCSPMIYTNWEVNGNQSQTSGEHCAMATVDGYWGTVLCDEVMPFVCERPLTGAGSGTEVTGPDDGTCGEISAPSQSFSASLPFNTSSVATETAVSSSGYDMMTSVGSSEVIGSSLNTNTVIPLASSSTDDIVQITKTESSSSSEWSSMSVWSSYDDTVSPHPSTAIWSSIDMSVQSQEPSIQTSGYDKISSTYPHVINSPNARSGSVISASPLTNVDATVVSSTTDFSNSDSVSLQNPDHTQTYTSVTSGFRQTSTHSITTYISNSNPGQVVYQVCRCFCIPENRLNDLSSQSVDAKKKEIRGNLLLDRRNLTKTVIKYISAPDERKSSTSIGATGVTLIVFTSLFILSSDVLAFFQHRHYEKTREKH